MRARDGNGERVGNSPTARATIAEACRRANSDPWMNNYPRELSGVVGKCGVSGLCLFFEMRANNISAVG